jgi:RimJ/RimL family protein N-acetyltransferase
MCISSRTTSRTERLFRLEDGTEVHTRFIEPADRAALRRAFGRLSAESRYHRFMGHVSDLSEEMWRYLTEVDGHDHVAIVAVALRHGHDSDEEIVGVARYVRLAEDRHSAELAITVADGVQRQGLGLRLAELLLDAGLERGVRRFVAHAFHDNFAVRRLLARFGRIESTEGPALVLHPDRPSLLRPTLALWSEGLAAWWSLSFSAVRTLMLFQGLTLRLWE